MPPTMHPVFHPVASGLRVAAVSTCVAAVVCGVATAADPSAAAPRVAPRPRTAAIVDGAVVPAGGGHCRHCGPAAGCPLHGGHKAECRDGLCAPHCPVRPSQHGYYRTQWRRWPGAGVVPVSAEEAATPASPPPSQVPTVEEESPQVPADASPPPDDAAERQPADPIPPPAVDDEPVAPREEPVPTEDPAPAVPKAAAPGGQPPVPPSPPGEPPIPPAPDDADADAKLFDRSEVPLPVPEEPADAAGTMRYPAGVGRSVAAGSMPWRLGPTGLQRAAGSARGL